MKNNILFEKIIKNKYINEQFTDKNIIQNTLLLNCKDYLVSIKDIYNSLQIILIYKTIKKQTKTIRIGVNKNDEETIDLINDLLKENLTLTNF